MFRGNSAQESAAWGAAGEREGRRLLTSEETPGMDGVVGVHVAEVLQQRHEQQLVLDGGGEVHKLLRPVGHAQLRRHVRLWTGQTKSGFSPRGPLGVRPSTAPPSPRADRRSFDATPLAEAPRARALRRQLGKPL